jgi:hypothetical protein
MRRLQLEREHAPLVVITRKKRKNQILSLAEDQVYIEKVILPPEKTRVVQLEELVKERKGTTAEIIENNTKTHV